MSPLSLSRPAADESAPFYRGYIDQVPGEQIGEYLRTQAAEVERLLGPLDDAAARFRYAPGKWSVREVVGHLSDAERVFAYRALTIARGDRTALPAFEEDAWAAVSNADSRSLADLVGELRAVRAATLALFRSFGAAEWERTGTASGKHLAVRTLPYIIAGHERHHVAVLRERYGIG